MLWQCAGHRFENWDRPLLMGILNVTPDSFSDGGRFVDLDKALAHASTLVAEGADLLDIGGESTRPGATPVEAGEELARVLPVLRALRERHPQVALSIDTYKAPVAEAAVQSGACIINDVGAGLWDPAMPRAAARLGAGYVCMHSQGRPGTMQFAPSYGNVRNEVLSFLRQRQSALEAAGLASERVVFDPGIGFGKNAEHNLELLSEPAFLEPLQRPILWGLSRKSFLAKIAGAPANRLAGTLAAHAWLLRSRLPQIWRVHDVKPALDLIRLWRVLETA
jgi:dihydropteroate synthase